MKRERFEKLVRTIFAVKESEILCSEFFDILPRYVDLELSGRDPAATLPEVSHHLHQCPECNEVYLALLQATQAAGDPETT